MGNPATEKGDLMPKKAQKAKPGPKKDIGSTRTKQKLATVQRLKAATRILDLGDPSRVRDEQDDICQYIKSHNGLHRAVDTLFDCLNAKRTFYDLFSKKMCVEPDYATRLGAARSLIANQIGEPIKRQQILVGQVESEDQLRQKLADSPALCERVLDLINDVQARLEVQSSAQNQG